MRVINSYFETTSVNFYRGIIAPGKDFNDTPASYAYHKERKGLTDGSCDCGSGYQYTFRQLYKLRRIDYVIYSKLLKDREYYSSEIPYSDHNMVVWKGMMNEIKI